MIGIFCIFGASAMATVIYNFFLVNFDCTESVTCPTRDVRRWKFCDFIPQLFCRSGFPVAGTRHKCLWKKNMLWLYPYFEFRSSTGCILFEFIYNLVYFPSFKLGLDTSRHYWILFLHFYNFWAPSAQFQVTDITLDWILCLWRFHGLHNSILDTKRRLYYGLSCHWRVSPTKT